MITNPTIVPSQGPPDPFVLRYNPRKRTSRNDEQSKGDSVSKFQGYPPDTLKFLRALKKNNDRDWFKANQSRYESAIAAPSLQFIADVGHELPRISGLFQAIPRKSRGSMMRIYRDTRFSKDKTPYKTNIGIHFRHQVGKDVHAPGFYVHVEPKDVFIAAGIWRPEPKVAHQLREAIAKEPAVWKRATRSKTFASMFEMHGDSLKRPPRGLDPEHPLIEDLKRKDFIGVHEVAESSIESASFLTETIETFRKAKLLVRFLCNSLNLPF